MATKRKAATDAAKQAAADLKAEAPPLTDRDYLDPKTKRPRIVILTTIPEEDGRVRIEPIRWWNLDTQAAYLLYAEVMSIMAGDQNARISVLARELEKALTELTARRNADDGAPAPETPGGTGEAEDDDWRTWAEE